MTEKITPSTAGQDIFVHTLGLVDTIRENDVATFYLQNGNKGVNAVNVKIV